MKKALPPLNWFRAFDAASRHLSFTLAAQELGLTQSAISQHIRALETRLGAPLFLRRPKGLALTDAGRQLVPDVAAAMARLAEATDAFLPAKGDDVLTVATSVSIAQWFIAPNMPALLRTLPGLRLRLVTTVWPDDFAVAQADVEIRFGAPLVAGGDGAIALGAFDLVAVARPDQFGDIKDLGPRQLAALPLIQPVGITETWAKLLRNHGIKREVRPALFTDSHGLAVDLALSGAGVALTSGLIAAPALREGRLVAVPIGRVLGTEGYFIDIRSPVRSSFAEPFGRWVQDVIDQTGQA